MKRRIEKKRRNHLARRHDRYMRHRSGCHDRCMRFVKFGAWPGTEECEDREAAAIWNGLVKALSESSLGAAFKDPLFPGLIYGPEYAPPGPDCSTCSHRNEGMDSAACVACCKDISKGGPTP